jgi:hypothetical protein
MTNKNELYLETMPYTVNLKAMDGERKMFRHKISSSSKLQSCSCFIFRIEICYNNIIDVNFDGIKVIENIF